MEKIFKNNTNYFDLTFIFGLFWIFVLLPKFLQLFGLIFILFFTIYKVDRQIKIPSVMYGFIAYFVVHFLSIFINFAVYGSEISRVVAALNTDLIWLIAVYYFSLVYNGYCYVNLKRVFKYCYFNILILFCVYLISKIINVGQVVFYDGRQLWTFDYVNQVEETRFVGLFEYSALVGFFVILQFPFANFYALTCKRRAFSYCLLNIIAIVVVMATNSRMPVVILILEMAVSFVYFINQNYRRYSIIIFSVVIIIFSLLIAFRLEELWTSFINVLSSREGSNNTRIRVYLMSLSLVFDKSPIIGMGIKYMVDDIPLGSHSTYIGFIYKSGVVGTIFAIVGFISIFCKLIRRYKSNRNCLQLYLIFIFILFLLMFSLEDIDGADWLIIYFFIIMAIYCSGKFQSR